MNVVILSARSGWHTDELCRALMDRGHGARICPYETLVAHLASPEENGGADLQAGDPPESIFTADAVLARIIPGGSLEQIIYRVDALHWLEERGIPVMNSPRAIERSVDKFYTTALLHHAGLPTPHTVVCERVAEAMPVVRAMLARSDVIIKPLFGSMGHGMTRVSDADVAFRVVQALERIRAVFYLQEAVNHGGRDIRAFVVGGRVLAAIERVPSAGEWRANVARGAAVRPLTLSMAWEALAVRAAAAVGAEYAGVDLITSETGDVFIIEVNGIPGWQALQRATDTDVAGAVVRQLEQRVARPPAAARANDAAGVER